LLVLQSIEASAAPMKNVEIKTGRMLKPSSKRIEAIGVRAAQASQKAYRARGKTLASQPHRGASA
jgi:hypothetical protein